ncbi:MAG TPA: universal stress protein [Gammaproteobacteria bacterium]|nr:universal stress protein [Gammaproteobacteria bacterium]
MLRTILVPLDGSAVAEQGLWSACRLAKETGATLSLVRGVPYFVLERKDHAADRAAVREAREYLRTVQDNLTRDGFAVRMEVVPGDPVGAILFAADMQEVDLISICTHGRSGLSHALVGSVAEAVLRRSDTPILITRAMAEPARQPIVPCRAILVPLDGTPPAEAALAYLARERIGDQAELILLRAVAPVMPPYVPGLMGDAAAEFYNEANRETQQRLLGAEAYLKATGVALQRTGTWSARPTLGAAASEILAAAKPEVVDLIVLVTHGRHGLERLIYGSVARELLHHAEVPVLILPVTQADVRAPEPYDENRQTT